MKCIIDNQVVLARVPEGPLAAPYPLVCQISEGAGVCQAFDSPEGSARCVFQPMAQTTKSQTAWHHVGSCRTVLAISRSAHTTSPR